MRRLSLEVSMEDSTLSLSVEKGPRKGETLECKVGSSIHIGRVVRGNTLAIKDPGISQKHLAICYIPEFTRWTATDLGSSNGTFINDTLISPEEPSCLSDGDVIVIGEATSISVNISAAAAQPAVVRRRGLPPRPRKALEGKDRISRKDEAPGLERRVTRASSRLLKRKLEDEDSAVSDSGHADAGEEKVVKESNAAAGEKEGGVEEVEYDMDTMSLGVWFDNMEKFLAKTINTGAEEIIAKLREKARLFAEFVDQNSNLGAE